MTMTAAQVHQATDVAILERGACPVHSIDGAITFHDSAECSRLERMEAVAAAHRQVLADRADAYNEGEL